MMTSTMVGAPTRNVASQGRHNLPGQRVDPAAEHPHIVLSGTPAG